MCSKFNNLTRRTCTIILCFYYRRYPIFCPPILNVFNFTGVAIKLVIFVWQHAGNISKRSNKTPQSQQHIATSLVSSTSLYLTHLKESYSFLRSLFELNRMKLCAATKRNYGIKISKICNVSSRTAFTTYTYMYCLVNLL